MAPAMTAPLDPRITAFLSWRSQFPWAQFVPVDAAKLANMPIYILDWTARVEATLWQEINPEQGFWHMEHWLANPPPKPRRECFHIASGGAG